jgi:hypothetical protein
MGVDLSVGKPVTRAFAHSIETVPAFATDTPANNSGVQR